MTDLVTASAVASAVETAKTSASAVCVAVPSSQLAIVRDNLHLSGFSTTSYSATAFAAWVDGSDWANIIVRAS